MKEYKVSFWKMEWKENATTRKLERTGVVDYLGSVTIDDTGCSDGTTLVGKAFRWCSDKCLSADKTSVQEI